MEKYKGKAIISSQERIATDIYSLWLEAGEIAKEAKPGQFMTLYPNDTSKMLPRPISICEVYREKGRIRLVYRVTGRGTGTEGFSMLGAGEDIQVMGPLGNGFPLPERKKAMLIGGGIGIPPMLELSKELNCVNQIIAGYKDEIFLADDLEKYGELHIATEDGSAGTKGNVLDVIRKKDMCADIIFACGPTPMLQAVKSYAKGKGIPCYISMEERMACGIGACLACVCRSVQKDEHTNVNNKRVCKEGPVFLSTEVELS